MSNQSSTDSKPCTDLSGDVCWTESFRPINNDVTITDDREDKWIQLTVSGYYRESDNYFWPCDPTNTNNFINRLPPTILEVDAERKSKSPNYNNTLQPN